MTGNTIRSLLAGTAAIVLFATGKPLPATQPLYWNELIPGGAYGGSAAQIEVKRAPLDGSASELLANTDGNDLGFIDEIAYEPAGDQIYWTDRNRGRIQRADRDGSNIQTVYSSTYFGQPSSLQGLALDSSQSQMYWADSNNQTVRRAGFDGSGDIDLLSGVYGADLALDLTGSHLYVAVSGDSGGLEGPFDSVERINLDGTGHQVIIDNLIQVIAVAIDPLAQKLYWVDLGYNSMDDTLIGRSNLDGTGTELLLTNLPDVILDLEVEPTLNALFWTSRDEGLIKRSDLDGSNVQTVLSGLSNPQAVMVVPEPQGWLLALPGLALIVLAKRRRR